MKKIIKKKQKKNNNNGVNIEFGKTNRLKALCMMQFIFKSNQTLYSDLYTYEHIMHDEI